MCGGCPGGAVISFVSAHITLRGIKAQVTRDLSARCSPRFRVTTFGNSWVVTSVTGKQTVCSSIEEAARAVLGAVASPPDAAYFAASATPLSALDLDALSASEIVDALLQDAASHRPAGAVR